MARTREDEWDLKKTRDDDCPSPVSPSNTPKDHTLGTAQKPQKPSKPLPSSQVLPRAFTVPSARNPPPKTVSYNWLSKSSFKFQHSKFQRVFSSHLFNEPAEAKGKKSRSKKGCQVAAGINKTSRGRGRPVNPRKPGRPPKNKFGLPLAPVPRGRPKKNAARTKIVSKTQKPVELELPDEDQLKNAFPHYSVPEQLPQTPPRSASRHSLQAPPYSPYSPHSPHSPHAPQTPSHSVPSKSPSRAPIINEDVLLGSVWSSIGALGTSFGSVGSSIGSLGSSLGSLVSPMASPGSSIGDLATSLLKLSEMPAIVPQPPPKEDNFTEYDKFLHDLPLSERLQRDKKKIKRRRPKDRVGPHKKFKAATTSVLPRPWSPSPSTYELSNGDNLTDGLVPQKQSECTTTKILSRPWSPTPSTFKLSNGNGLVAGIGLRRTIPAKFIPREPSPSALEPSNNDWLTNGIGSHSKLQCGATTILSRPLNPRKLELPHGDKRKNMIPKVVLRDIGHIISMVCPKAAVVSKTPPPPVIPQSPLKTSILKKILDGSPELSCGSSMSTGETTDTASERGESLHETTDTASETGDSPVVSVRTTSPRKVRISPKVLDMARESEEPPDISIPNSPGEVDEFPETTDIASERGDTPDISYPNSPGEVQEYPETTDMASERGDTPDISYPSSPGEVQESLETADMASETEESPEMSIPSPGEVQESVGTPDMASETEESPNMSIPSPEEVQDCPGTAEMASERGESPETSIPGSPGDGSLSTDEPTPKTSSVLQAEDSPNSSSQLPMIPTNLPPGITLSLVPKAKGPPSSLSTPTPRKLPGLEDRVSVVPLFPKSSLPNSSSSVLLSSSNALPSYPAISISPICKSVALTDTEPVSDSSHHSDDFGLSEQYGAISTKLEENDPVMPILSTRSTTAIHKVSTSTVKSYDPSHSIKNGFLGFPQEDLKKKKRACFHVNTNILATSLDLLDLHTTAGMPTGSPSSCSHCKIVFSSVKHCKYHQSVISLDRTDPSLFNNIQEDGVWLCPWCPLMCFSSDYLTRHKVVCREKGRCQQEHKVSSTRKNASSWSKRRNSIPSACNATPTSHTAVHNLINRFKEVH